jgi:hypothetical protein
LEIAISGDTLLWIEVYAGALFLATMFIWIGLNRLPVAHAALAMVVTVLSFAGFRPPIYNSDTLNYYSYVAALSYLDIGEAIFSTKLEPFHSIIITLLRDFRIWIVVESIVQIVGIYICFKNRRNDYSFIVLCAFVLTLSTSSLRYAGSLIFFMYFVYISGNRVIDAVRMTAILSCLHASMLLSGALSFRRLAVPLIVSLACVAILYERSLLGARAELDLTDPSRGFKVLATVCATMFYFAVRSPRSISLYHVAYGLSILLLFAVSALVLPTFNRFVIMGGLVILSNDWETFRGDRNSDTFDRAFIFALSGMILAPYILVLPTIYFNGTW